MKPTGVLLLFFVIGCIGILGAITYRSTQKDKETEVEAEVQPMPSEAEGLQLQKTNWIRGVAIALLCLGFIGSLIAGKALEIPNIDLSSYRATYQYNWFVMLSGLIGTLIMSLLFFALATIFDRQSLIYVKLSKRENAEAPAVEEKKKETAVSE